MFVVFCFANFFGSFLSLTILTNPIPDQNVDEAGMYNYNVPVNTFTSDDGDFLRYSLVESPSFLSEDTVGITSEKTRFQFENGFVEDVVVTGDLLYACYSTVNPRFAIYNISASTNFSDASALSSVSGSCTGIAVDEDVAFVMTGNDIYSYNVSNPLSIIEISYITRPGDKLKPVLDGEYLYILIKGRLNVYNVSDPKNILVVKNNFQTEGESPNYMEVLHDDEGDWLLVSDYDSGFTIVNIDDPSDPSKLTNVQLVGNVTMTVMHPAYPGYLLVADSVGFVVYNMTNKLDIEVIYETSSQSVNYIAADSTGTYAFISGTNGMEVFDISNVSDISFVTSIDSRVIGHFDKVIIQERYLFFYYGDGSELTYHFGADMSLPTNILDVSDVNDIKVGCECINLGYFSGIESPIQIMSPLSKYLYSINGGDRGLVIYDISDKEKTPFVVGFHYTNYANDVSTDDKEDYLYLADDTEGVQIIEITNKDSPVLLNTILDQDGNGTNSVFVDGDMLYVCSTRTGFKIFNVSDRVNPSLVSQLEVTDVGASKKMKKVGQYVYILTEDRALYILDVLDPTTPVVVGKSDNVTEPGLGQEIVVENGYAYILSTDTTLDAEGNLTGIVDIIDVRNETHPEWVSSIHPPSEEGLRGIVVKYDLVYISSKKEGISLYETSNKLSPSKISMFKPSFDTGPLVSQGNTLYNLDFGGLVSYDFGQIQVRGRPSGSSCGVNFVTVGATDKSGSFETDVFLLFVECADHTKYIIDLYNKIETDISVLDDRITSTNDTLNVRITEEVSDLKLDLEDQIRVANDSQNVRIDNEKMDLERQLSSVNNTLNLRISDEVETLNLRISNEKNDLEIQIAVSNRTENMRITQEVRDLVSLIAEEKERLVRLIDIINTYVFSSCNGINSSSPNVCSGRGICVEKKGKKGECYCSEGFGGSNCEVDNIKVTRGDLEEAISDANSITAATTSTIFSVGFVSMVLLVSLLVCCCLGICLCIVLISILSISGNVTGASGIVSRMKSSQNDGEETEVELKDMQVEDDDSDEKKDDDDDVSDDDSDDDDDSD